ncbi:MAG: NACHT domain-containing protein [Anaerolineaceae bacterium]|jgi:hypothetical protein|nr:NACHT domain-containing protein [Anaerolineaceae bacterium]OQY88078.1 MAG: hypothetical protein B6D38_10670 [Anaerolineae bacterium UTCFX1]
MNRYSLIMEAYTELMPEIASSCKAAAIATNPPLRKTLRELGAIPTEGLFMGIATDALPVLLNLHDAVPGPILIVGDAGAGKTDLLRLIARAAEITHPASALQFATLTNHPEEWNEFENTSNSIGIFPLYADSAQEFLFTAASWARESKPNSRTVLLLLDDLDAATNLDFEARQTLRWLLLRGPARRVWPIVTLNTSRSENLMPWLEAFRSRIFGSIKDDRRAQQLLAVGANLQTLNSNAQFTLREGKNWLRFWLPGLD